MTAEAVLVSYPLGSGGGGAAATTLQDAYDNSAGVPHITLAAAQPFTLRDNATPLAGMLTLEDSAGSDFFATDQDEISYGLTGNRAYQISRDPTGRAGIRFLPDGRTQTTAPTTTYAVQWDSLVISDIPGGAPFGNDTAPAMVGSFGECRFDGPGNLFSSSLLFNQGTTITMNGVNVGPVYTMVNQPTIRTGTLGGTRTCSQHNALRIQPRWGPNLAGSLVQTSAELMFFTAAVDATVGTSSVTLMNYMAAKNVTLTAGGVIGTLNVLDIENITGPTTIRGINSAMASGTFINHTGSAPSNFAGEVRINNAVNLTLGTNGGNRVSLSRTGAGQMRMFGQGGTNNEGLTWDFDGAADNVTVTSTTGAGLRLNLGAVSIGTTSAAPSANWQFALTPGAKTITVGGDFSRALFSASANVTIDAALVNFATWLISSPGGTIGSGSVTNAANLLVQTSPGVGTNRYGLLITSNPTGGTLNYAFRQSNASALARFDGRLDINRGIALGGGAPAVLGTIGGSGPTVATQAQWVEIDIGGVAHWIPVWT